MAPPCCLEGLLFMSLLLSILPPLALRSLHSFTLLLFQRRFCGLYQRKINIHGSMVNNLGSKGRICLASPTLQHYFTQKRHPVPKLKDSADRLTQAVGGRTQGACWATGSESASAPGGVRVRAACYRRGGRLFQLIHITFIFRTYPRTVLRKAHSSSGFASKV